MVFNPNFDTHFFLFVVGVGHDDTDRSSLDEVHSVGGVALTKDQLAVGFALRRQRVRQVHTLVILANQSLISYEYMVKLTNSAVPQSGALSNSGVT